MQADIEYYKVPLTVEFKTTWDIDLKDCDVEIVEVKVEEVNIIKMLSDNQLNDIKDLVKESLFDFEDN